MARITHLRTTRRRTGLGKAATILLVAFVVVALITAVVAYNLVNNLVRSWNITTIAGSPDLTKPTQVNAQGTPIPIDVPMQSVSGPPAEPWDGTSRVTILVMGLDYRDWENGDVPRTDTMMLLTIDPLTKTAGMLSIPRDMWVNIPRYGYYKINQAYFFGALNKLPGGGPGLAVETVRQFIGVPINFYAQVDFAAFVKFIDTIGGIPINVPEDITVDPLGKGNTVTLKQGKMTYSGDVALAYARARYTAGGDFDRAARQQQVILGIRERIVRLNMLPTLIAKSGELYQELSDGIKTNMTLIQVVELANLGLQIPYESIKKGVIGPNEVQFAKSPDGLDILVPLPDRIRIVRDEIFTAAGPVSPAAAGQDAKALALAEKATISVRNGSNANGVAAKMGDFFKTQGLNVTDESNADKYYAQSQLIVYGSKPYTAQYLATTLNIPNARIINTYDPNATVDVVLIVGQDWSAKLPQ